MMEEAKFSIFQFGAYAGRQSVDNIHNLLVHSKVKKMELPCNIPVV